MNAAKKPPKVPPTRLGVCAGGNFYAHGVEMVSGSATITVKSLRIKS